MMLFDALSTLLDHGRRFGQKEILNKQNDNAKDNLICLVEQNGLDIPRQQIMS